MNAPGALVISLDFELYWGVRDVVSLPLYRENLLGVRRAVPAILRLFEQHGVHATWATVGFLFARSRAELAALRPERLPTYRDPTLSPYGHLEVIGEDEASDPFHYAPTLIDRIAETPGQEIGTHTFSHYYCLEEGQTAAQFGADLDAAARAGARYGDVCRSLVFPRNQFNPAYLGVLRSRGVAAYRSNGSHWAYRARPGAADTAPRRAFRLGDAYLPLSGSGARRIDRVAPGPVDVPASAFLRPFSPALRPLRRAALERLAFGLTRAATDGRVFHLWWHPHNFGRYLPENLEFLGALLERVGALRTRHGLASLTMAEAARAQPGAA